MNHALSPPTGAHLTYRVEELVILPPCVVLVCSPTSRAVYSPYVTVRTGSHCLLHTVFLRLFSLVPNMSLAVLPVHRSAPVITECWVITRSVTTPVLSLSAQLLLITAAIDGSDPSPYNCSVPE